MQRYNPKDIEPKWQKFWEETGTYTADLQSNKPKYIAMSMFNYPSGAGIHIGHAMNYTISDVKARFKRQQGLESYHPVGWDAFGLPAENYAIKSGVSPQESMATIIPMYHKQYKAMGWSNDWEKEIATHLPEYYKWTQWIFCELYRNSLVYQDSRLQWWCSIDKTVLANEQVIDGKCWRHDGPNDPLAEKREVKQWFFKITDYADELLEATDGLDWSDSVKLAQKNWIGKSLGAEIDFPLSDTDKKITVFTTRPDTIFGATFMVLAPEHELVHSITADDQKSAVNDYIKKAEKKTDVERQAEREKSGVFTGAYAINPANNTRIPIWVADYVLVNYGTGAIMAVPAHDERDNEFAKKFDLPITKVIEPKFINTSDDSAVKAGEDFVKREAVCAIVRNPKDDTYLCISWKTHIMNGLVTGGVEAGEDPVEAAKREIHEETGYKNVRLVDDPDLYIHSLFYHRQKQQNRWARFHYLIFELENEERDPIDEKEAAMLDVVWKSKAELGEYFSVVEGKFIIDLLDNPRAPYENEGIMVNSGEYNNQESSDAREQIVADLERKGLAKQKINYRMNDWSVSRQRYWGAPIPIIHCPKCGPQLVPEEDLPVILPEIDDYQPTGDGRSALARATDWLKVTCPNCEGDAERETDTLDTYVDSSFYMYRYFDPHNQHAIYDSGIVKKWEPIDFYNGADHATAHLLYARFIGHFFKKIGLVNDPEPFKQFLFNGKVTAADGQMFSKSKGNGVDPLEIIGQGYGADALRTYLMFAAPLDLWIKWDPQGVPGTFRFLSRVWNLVQEYLNAQPSIADEEWEKTIYGPVHEMIKKVTQDLEDNHYNTAIAAMMQCTNELYKLRKNHGGKNDVWKTALSNLVACVAPFAPHTAEELWNDLGHSTTVHRDTWPKYDNKYLTHDKMTIVVQVNGKLRAQIDMPVNATEEEIVGSAKAYNKVKPHLEAKEIKKTIYVPGKLVNFVVT